MFPTQLDVDQYMIPLYSYFPDFDMNYSYNAYCTRQDLRSSVYFPKVLESEISPKKISPPIRL